MASLILLRESESPESPGFATSKLNRALLLSQVANPGRVRWIIESIIPWSTGRSEPYDLPVLGGPWKVAVVGAHPSLGADVAFAVQAAMGSVEHRYFGLSCPTHHSAVHHCSFRCEVFTPQNLQNILITEEFQVCLVMLGL